MVIKPTWFIQQIIPPALLTYFGWALYLCVTEMGPEYLGDQLGHPLLGLMYSITAACLIPSLAILFLRLYFLPASRSVPSHEPPSQITSKTVIFECLSPAQAATVRAANGQDGEGLHDEPLVNRCWKGKCNGRWKPARARHCSECGTCRAGFDHHCAFYANCLTAPYIPTFMALLTLTPPTILLLSLPLYPSLARRALAAYRLSWSDDSIKTWWYSRTGSWVVAGGPVGRYVGGIILGWKALDRIDGGGSHRLEIGILAFIGLILALITGGLAAATRSLIHNGHLTVDRERARSLARVRAATSVRKSSGEPIPPETLASLERWTTRHYFWVPDTTGGGQIVECESPQPYDLGRQGNWERVMGVGWGWVLPWQAMRRGVSHQDILNWRVNPQVERTLRRAVEEVS